MRLQLALNVADIDSAVSYYSQLFDTEPHKRRDGYANFAIDEPPLKLVLFESPDADERINHLGVEVFDEKGVADATARIVSAGIADEQEIASTCCYATQDKIWSSDPQGLRWEWYRVLDDSETFFGHGDGIPVEATPSACCT